MCERAGLPFARIARPSDLFEDPHLKASGGLIPITLPDGRTCHVPALPIAMDGARLPLRLDLPKPGEHDAEILGPLRAAREAAE
jgi:crotonobetainyl-CoA:carnitine CoA-transferase CaiB-like acyl-CoA transferase